MKRKTYLFIDGSNLYAGQYELFGPRVYLDFPRFIRHLTKTLKLSLDKIYFYASYSPQSKKPTSREKLYLKNEALFYRSVKQTTNVIFFTGYHSKTSGKEKEVDVKLAVDIVHFAHLNKYSDLFLMSGDADFMYAIKIAQQLGKHIAVVALQNRVPQRFAYHYETYILLFNAKKIPLKHSKGQKIRPVYLEKDTIIQRI